MKTSSFILFLFTALTAIQSSFGGQLEVLFTDFELDNQTPMSLLLTDSGPVSGYAETDVDTGITIKYGLTDKWSIAYSRFNANTFAIASDFGLSESVTEKIQFQDIMLEYSYENAISEKIFCIATLGFGLAWADYEINAFASTEEVLENISFSTKDRVLTFSVGIGIGYNLNENTDLILHYKNNNVREIDLSDVELPFPTWDMDNETTNVGVRIKF